MKITMQKKLSEPIKPDSGGDKSPLPVMPGSIEELAETALIVGNPGAFGVTCNTVERLVRSQLLWPC